MWQTLIVSMMVAAATAYATWTLMPAAGRRRLATALLKLPIPEAPARMLRRAAQATAGCGCDGCDHAPAKSAQPASGAAKPITFHPRVRR